MKIFFKGVLILFSLTLVLGLMTVPQATAADTETFVNKAPDFTLTVPKWVKSKSKNPKSVLRKALDVLEITSLDVVVDDLPEGKTYKDLAKDLTDLLKKQYQASGFETQYEKEIKLKDDTPAYELEVRWSHPQILLYTYEVVVFKDKKMIIVSVTSDNPISKELKEIPLSLSFK